MILNIRHTTNYRFDRPVFLEPHILRFRPRTDFRQRLINYELNVDPLPEGRKAMIDKNGNLAEIAWFSGIHNELRIGADMTVEMFPVKPLDFLIHPQSQTQLPFNPGIGDPLLESFLVPGGESTGVRGIAEDLMKMSNYQTVGFLTGTTSYLHSEIEIINRETGEPYKPVKTLQLKKGSCRDIAVLQMALLREAGIPSRFVSGYNYNFGREEDHDLHAWMEAYIGGAGWIGFDPTSGLAVANDHIAVAVSPDQKDTLPVTGSFRGTANSVMESKVHISLVEE